MLWGILWLNLLVAVVKLIYGYRSGAIAMTADGIHSLLDGASNVLGLLGVAVARRPPDADHPYGHRKYETFAALGVVGMLFLGCREIVASAIERLRNPRVPEIGPEGFWILGLTLSINLLVVLVERRKGRELRSDLLLADAAHTGSDVAASLLVLASFALIRMGIGWADLAASAVIVALIVRAGIEMLRGSLATLSDTRRIAPGLVEAVAREEPGVREAHNVRSRGAADDIYLDLHVLVDPAIPIAEAHRLGHRVEARLRDRFAGISDVVVHVEPALDSERAHPGASGGLQE